MTRLLAAVRWALRNELRMYAGAARLLRRRPDVPHQATPVRYVGAVSAVLWGFTGVSTIEVIAVHLIVPWESVRLGLDILGIWGVVTCVGMTGCHYVYPHLITETALRVRFAARPDVVAIPIDAVASVSTRERSHQGRRSVSVDETGALVVAVGSRTNLDLRLARPVEATVRGHTQLVREVRIYVDEARETRATLLARLQSGADSRP